MDTALTSADPRRGTLLMLVSTAAFVANALLVRELGARFAVDSWLLSTVRFAVGLAVIFLFYRTGGRFRFGNLFHNPHLVLRGVVGGIGVYLYYLTIVRLGAGRATFISNTYVVLAGLLAVVVLKEPLAPALLIGSSVSLGGLALLTDLASARPVIGFYDFLAVLGALASAVVVVTIRRLHRDEHTSTIFGAQCLYGLLFCFAPAAGRYHSPAPAAWALLFISGLCAGAGQLAMTRAYRDLPVARGSLLQMLVPLGIAVGGRVFYDEAFTSRELVGAALILGGTLVTLLWRSPRHRRPVATPPIAENGAPVSCAPRWPPPGHP